MSIDQGIDPIFPTRGRAPDGATGASDRASQSAGPVTEKCGQGLTQLQPEHLPRLTALFREVFPDNPLSLLGSSFLLALLSSFVSIPATCGYVYFVDGEIIGFVVGTTDSRVYRKELVRRRWPTLLAGVVSALLRSPALARPIIAYLTTFPLFPRDRVPARNGEPSPVPPASLIFLGVTRNYRGRGIAAALTSRFLQHLADCQVGKVKLAVGATNERAIRFYEKQGWRVSGCFEVPSGGYAYRLIYNLAGKANAALNLARPAPTDGS
ncbi:MAG TPA: GNAT family N-acetyltransferase [Chloroflexota bacterium]|nr:GNAT family N-acetyltransferase [Chloroflexota bacterium]